MCACSLFSGMVKYSIGIFFPSQYLYFVEDKILVAHNCLILLLSEYRDMIKFHT